MKTGMNFLVLTMDDIIPHVDFDNVQARHVKETKQHVWNADIVLLTDGIRMRILKSRW